jgi:hypothetical protein
MADTKITALTALTAADPANDVIPIVDVSDTTMAASGTTKKISVNNILGASGTATLASATITGAATVGTTLGVTGASTLASVGVTGAATVGTTLLVGTNATLTNGNVIIGTSGKGIDFSATADGSGTMTSELLNDYEEGTWTIGLTFGGGNTGLTTALNTGRYTKIGRQVTVCGRLELSNKGSSTGAAVITGLPFSIASGNDSQQAASFRFNGVSYTGSFQGYGGVSSTSINLEQISEAGSPTDITNSNFSNATSIQISFTYTV